MTLQQNSTYWVIGTLAVAMLPQLFNMPGWLATLAAIILLWRLLLASRQSPPLNAIFRVVMIGVAIAALILAYDGLVGRRAAVSMLTLMMALKLLETYRIRDARIITSLCLFLSISQFLFSQDLWMLFYSTLVTILVLITLGKLQREDAYQPLLEAKKKIPDFDFGLAADFKYILKLIVIALPITISMFLFFPRWSSPLWGMPEETLDAKTGLSDSMSPGTIEALLMDDSPAFRASFIGDAPARNELYWRGPVFWNFDGQQWSQGFLLRNIRRTELPPETMEPTWRYSIQLEPNEQKWLFSLDYPVAIPDRTRLGLDFQLTSRKPITELHNYDMVSAPGFIDSPTMSTSLQDIALRLPESFNPRTQEFVDQLRQQYPNNLEFIQQVLSHFNDQPFRYTLSPPLLGRNTVDEFLFETRQGYCEHYASAFTVMMRMAGIPARVVTGYQGGWYSEIGNYFLIRNSDAHAWAEVWLGQSGWVRFDPTGAVSPARIEQGALQALGARRHWLDYDWLRSVRNGFDLLQRGWNDWVIAFNADRQSRLLSPFGLEKIGANTLVLILAALLAISGVIAYLLMQRTNTGPKPDAAIKLWRHFCQRLQKLGINTTASEGAMELAERVTEESPDLGQQISNVAQLYYACRYALTDVTVADLKQAIKTFQVNAKHIGTQSQA